MTQGEIWRNNKLSSSHCHVIDGVYYYVKDYRGKYAVVLKADEAYHNIKLPEYINTSEGNNIPVEEINYIAFAETELETISLPNTLKRIDTAAFRDCKSLVRVDFPAKMESIKEDAFCRCVKLKSIRLPEYVDSLERAIFAGCSSLEHFILPKNIEAIPSSMFAGCVSLTTIDFPSHITMIGYYSFEGCQGISKIELGNNIQSVDTGAFAKCTGIESLVIKNANIKLSSECFDDCKSLKNIQKPSSTFTLEDSCFVGCNNLDKKIALKQTKFGDYLKQRKKQEEKEERQRRMREKKWYPIWDAAQTVLALLIIAPIGIAGYFLFAVMAQSIVVVLTIAGCVFVVGVIIIGLYEWITGNRVRTDLLEMMNSPVVIIPLMVIGVVIGLIMLYNMFFEP